MPRPRKGGLRRSRAPARRVHPPACPRSALWEFLEHLFERIAQPDAAVAERFWREPTDAQGRVWLEKRPAKGIWAGLHCLPVFDSHDNLLAALPSGAAHDTQELPPFVHVLTHKDLHLHPVLLQGVQPQGEGARWVEAQEWSRLGLPAPMR